MVKLPKQWRHWCKLAGLKPQWMPRTKDSKSNMVGKGRNWRVTCDNKFQVSEPLSVFDRWANSALGSIDLPTTEKDFLKAVGKLLGKSDEQN